MFTGTVTGKLLYPVKYGVYAGTQITSMRLMSKRSRKDKDGSDADFIDVKIFGKYGESLVAFGLERGAILSAFGEVVISNYEKNNGDKVKDISLIAQRIEVLKWVTADKPDQDDAVQPASQPLEPVQEEQDLPF